MRPIGLVQRRRMLDRAKSSSEKYVAAAALKQLDKRFKVVKRSLRKGYLRGKLAKAGGLFYKQDGDPEWDEWADLFAADLEAALEEGAKSIGDIENRVWTSRGYSQVDFSPADVVDNYQTRIGRKITAIGKDTRDKTQDMIAEWYKTDAGLPELIDQLAPIYGEERAALIAATEMANVTSEVAYEQMQELGVGKWIWDGIQDYAICPICQELHGQVFELGDPMPPDASHPRCRCGVLFADAEGRELGKALAKGFLTLHVFKGGPGSGHWGHAGVPGQLGGSAPKGEGGAGSPVATLRTKSSALMESIAKTGGFSTTMGGRNPKGGYMVSTLKGREKVIGEAAKVTPKDIIKYAVDNRDVLTLKNNFMGAWTDEGKLYIDVSTNFSDLNEALAAGAAADQIAIWDVVKGETIYVK